MQKETGTNWKLLLQTEEDIFSTIVGSDHAFRKLNAIINFKEISNPLRECYSDLGTIGFDVEKGLKTLLIQFWENYSDRQMEQAVRENMAVRWFCGFSLTEVTPDHTYFCKLRKRLGTKRIADTFEAVNAILQSHGLFGNVFAFIDASTIITKTALWEERDQAIADGAEKLNNKNVEKYAADKDARWGAKSKHNIWFGHKRNLAVDMRHGLIKKVAITPANVPDYQVITSVCPKQGAVFMDKLYDTKATNDAVRANGCYAATIRKNNNPIKNRDLDRFRSSLRMPFEGTFSKLSKRARYRGHAKVTMQAFLQSIAYNLKKAVRIMNADTLNMGYAS
mgnify:CR=1 FL=1